MSEYVMSVSKVIASVSGGKDSAALSLWLHEQGIEHERVFLDTGWEWPETYDYIRGPLAKAIGHITEIGYPGGMKALIRKKGMFPSRKRRFCTDQLKIAPMNSHITDLVRQGFSVVNAVGIRRQESDARSRAPEWSICEWAEAVTWQPLVNWTFEDVVEIHRRHGLKPNPLYLRGFERVGCAPCIFARKKEIAALARDWPERIDEIEALEAEVAIAAHARAEAKGTTLEERGHHAPCFFTNPTTEKNTKGGHSGKPWPIREVVKWARTSHGGRQFEMFSGDPPGCMRWGLCDVGGASSSD